jgi:ABC-type uncharacterized transport system permease subunit
MATPVEILFLLSLQMSVPLVLTALGGMFSERSGVVNIGLEGMMLVGAFSAVAVTFIARNPWIGLLGASLGGGALALVHAIICVKFKGNHIVSGAGLILIGAGLTDFGSKAVWGHKGYSDPLPINLVLPSVDIPGAENVPVIGYAISSMSPMIYVMFLLTIVCWYVLYKTPFGLRLRASGEDPSTLDAAGVNVEHIRIIGVVISGMMAGLGGAYLSIGYNSAFGSGMTAGRGFISLAALIFGNWTPIGCFLAGMFFGFLYGLRILIEGLQQFSFLDPYSEFVAMIPYAFVIIALAGIRRSIPPKSIGVPYEKEKRA